MTNTNIQFRTAKREYSTYQIHEGLWQAQCQALNPKTGKPWQATHCIGVKDWDAFALTKGDYVNGVAVYEKTIVGPRPATLPQGYAFSMGGFSTEAKAIEACRRHAAK